ncbi:uncharacterized protein LOC111265773 isoform X2 [Varroa jacobsoni]|uniref:uncharacterized protein LOC111265773 isoform X2 n=1 Tax=Varroa jacobsoni TaxID=62625 RepID=UPI000BFA2605|nr:uncharacterized protein LOC111265773 isoform X2 [Varroa jacobsoni]
MASLLGSPLRRVHVSETMPDRQRRRSQCSTDRRAALRGIKLSEFETNKREMLSPVSEVAVKLKSFMALMSKYLNAEGSLEKVCDTDGDVSVLKYILIQLNRYDNNPECQFIVLNYCANLINEDPAECFPAFPSCVSLKKSSAPDWFEFLHIKNIVMEQEHLILELENRPESHRDVAEACGTHTVYLKIRWRGPSDEFGGVRKVVRDKIDKDFEILKEQTTALRNQLNDDLISERVVQAYIDQIEPALRLCPLFNKETDRTLVTLISHLEKSRVKEQRKRGEQKRCQGRFYVSQSPSRTELAYQTLRRLPDVFEHLARLNKLYKTINAITTLYVDPENRNTPVELVNYIPSNLEVAKELQIVAHRINLIRRYLRAYGIIS